MFLIVVAFCPVRLMIVFFMFLYFIKMQGFYSLLTLQLFPELHYAVELWFPYFLFKITAEENAFPLCARTLSIMHL